MPATIPTPASATTQACVAAALLTAARELDPASIPSRSDAFETTKIVISAANTVAHLLAVCAAEMNRLGVAQANGGKTKALLITMGLAPSVADRLLRIGRATPSMRLLPGYASDGVFPAEHIDAIVQGLTHVARRALDGLCDEERHEVELTLIAQAMSGATPKQIAEKARKLGNHYAAETGGLPAGEDRSINDFTISETPDGRVAVRGDLDIVTGQKLKTAIDSLATPRPEPDGSTDMRSPGQQRADALDAVLDAAADNTTPFIPTPNIELNLTIPSDAPARRPCSGPARSPKPRRGCWRAIPRSPRSSSTGKPCPCRWAPRSDCSPPTCAKRSSSATSAASSAARPRGSGGATTSRTGARAAPPTWTTGACCARPATPRFTPRSGRSSWAPIDTPGWCHPRRLTRPENRYPPTTDAP